MSDPPAEPGAEGCPHNPLPTARGNGHKRGTEWWRKKVGARLCRRQPEPDAAEN